MFFSFIIPLYNCEDYISQCLDGIVLSTLPDNSYEILIVNDGSKDKGADICLEYSKKYPKIKLLNQENSGQGTARNHGLQHAQGDYVWFVDADDIVVSSALPVLYNEIKKDNSWDLISFNYRVKYPNHTESVESVRERMVFHRGQDYLRSFRGKSYLWNSIYKRTSLKSEFLDGISHIEDMCFNIQNILKFQRLLYMNIEGYVYNRANVSSTSHSHSEEATEKANRDAFIVYSTLYKDMLSSSDEEERTFLREVLDFGVAGHIYTMTKETTYQKTRLYIKRYQELELYPIRKTYNRKANLFRLIANNRLLLFICCLINHL